MTTLAALIAVNVAVFAVLSSLSCFWPEAGGPVVNVLSLDSVFETVYSKPWSLLTYSFVNVSVWHLAFNMLSLFLFGRLFSIRSVRLIAIYLAGSLGGGLFYLLLNPYFESATNTELIGASSSVIAIMSAVAVIEPSTKVRVPLFGDLNMKTIVVSAIVLFAVSLSAENAGGNLAHLGGVFAGTVCGIVLKRRLRRQTELREYGSLIDRVRMSGYNSLTSTEKKQLFEFTAKYR